MFVGFEQAQADLDEHPVVGALRFWLRAILGEYCHNELGRLKLLEEAVFGSQRLASSIGVVVDCPGHGTRQADAFSPAIRYLAGQGLIAGGALARPYLSPDSRFTVTLQTCIPPAQSPEVVALKLELAYDALLLASLFGGLGSRSRKGFGSFAIEQKDNGAGPQPITRATDDDGLRAHGRGALQRASEHARKLLEVVDVLDERSKRRRYTELFPNPPPTAGKISYPSLSAIRLRWFPTNADNWSEAMDQLGLALQEVRGSNPTIDHARVIAPLQAGTAAPGQLDPQFDILGLPVQFKGKVALTVRGTSDEDGDRRASPVLFTFNHLGGQWILSVLLFNSVFLPEGAAEIVKMGGQEFEVQQGDLDDTAYFWDRFPCEEPGEITLLEVVS